MNFPFPKILLIIVMLLSVLCQISNGQERGVSLKGQWSGSGLLCATPDGFTPSKDTIKINIYEQDNLKFKGRIERICHGHAFLQEVQGYLDKNKRNICFVDLENKDVIIGQVTSNSIIKLYWWDNREDMEITVYILSRAKSSPDKKDKKLDQIL
jgi:hypothetical protein